MLMLMNCIPIFVFGRNFSNLCNRIKPEYFLKIKKYVALNHRYSKQLNSNVQNIFIANFSSKSNHLETLVNNILGTTSLSDDEKDKKEDLRKSLNVLFSCGIKKSDLKNYKEILKSYPSHMKILHLTKMKQNPIELLPLLTLSLPTLQTAANRYQEDKNQNSKWNDRLSYLQEQLQLSLKDLVNLLAKHHTLLTLEFSKLDRKMKILKQGQISVESIVKDAWIFNYNEKLLSDRIHSAQSAGIPLKPWLLRCSKKYFNNWIIKWRETQNVLKGDDLFGYLTKKLDCNQEYIELLIKKNSHLLTINILKLDEMLNFLIEKGYTVEEIRLFPKIFCCSIKTLEKRYEEFYNIRGSKPTLPYLGTSKLHRKALKQEMNA